MQKADSNSSAGTVADSSTKDENLSVSSHDTKPNVSGLPLSNPELQDAELLKRFFHFIGDTIALLGADETFVKTVKGLEQNRITPEIIDEIRQFNCTQIDRVKTRLALCNTIKVKVAA